MIHLKEIVEMINRQEVKTVIKEVFFAHRHGDIYSLEIFQNLLLDLPVTREEARKLVQQVLTLNFDTLTVMSFIDWLNTKLDFEVTYGEMLIRESRA